jgi:hypothetical protein
LNYGEESSKVADDLIRIILEQGVASYEVHNVRKDGTPFWSQATTSVFEYPEHGPVLVAVQQDITDRKKAEDLLKKSLTEKEVLLQEIHHRVKNNLGVIDGLLQMQARRSGNLATIAALKESQNRIAAIALVHEKLYRADDLASVDFAQYVLDLTAHLFESYNTHVNQIKLTTKIHPISLDIDTAIPCGLIINELTSNALKYAFPDNQTGEIQVIFQQNSDQTLALTVRDNGIGLPEGFNLKQTTTLGMSLVQGLVKQIRGSLNISREAGTSISITFVAKSHAINHNRNI